MIKQEEAFKIGTISKVRGISGEVELRFTNDVFDRGDAEYLILDMEGILVPFFWTEYKFKNNETAIFQFEEIENEEKAKRLVGKTVYYPFAHVPHDEDETIRSLRELIGFKVYGGDNEFLGEIVHVNDTSLNIVVELETPTGKTLLLPFHEDFLVDLNPQKRTMTMDLPEGLLDLN